MPMFSFSYVFYTTSWLKDHYKMTLAMSYSFSKAEASSWSIVFITVYLFRFVEFIESLSSDWSMEYYRSWDLMEEVGLMGRLIMTGNLMQREMKCFSSLSSSENYFRIYMNQDITVGPNTCSTSSMSFVLVFHE